MDYTTVLDALKEKAQAESDKTADLKLRKPRKYAGIKDKGAFWRSLAEQLEGYLNNPNGHMPFSEKQAFYVSKAIPNTGTFWAFWKEERRKRGLWDNHERGCKAERGLDIRADMRVVCRSCGAELGLYVPTETIDPIYAATKADVEKDMPVLDLDFESDFISTGVEL